MDMDLDMAWLIVWLKRNQPPAGLVRPIGRGVEFGIIHPGGQNRSCTVS